MKDYGAVSFPFIIASLEDGSPSSEHDVVEMHMTNMKAPSEENEVVEMHTTNMKAPSAMNDVLNCT